MQADRWMMIVVGLVLMVASLLEKRCLLWNADSPSEANISPDVAIRVVVFSIGVLFFALGPIRS